MCRSAWAIGVGTGLGFVKRWWSLWSWWHVLSLSPSDGNKRGRHGAYEMNKFTESSAIGSGCRLRAGCDAADGARAVALDVLPYSDTKAVLVEFVSAVREGWEPECSA